MVLAQVAWTGLIALSTLSNYYKKVRFNNKVVPF